MWTKLKSININGAGIYRVKFDLKDATGGYTAKARVYKNGSPIGTERTNTTTTYTTFTEDLSFSVGDTCELWALGTTSSATIRNFRLYISEMPSAAID